MGPRGPPKRQPAKIDPARWASPRRNAISVWMSLWGPSNRQPAEIDAGALPARWPPRPPKERNRRLVGPRH
eukprot:4019703-Pyramimonas_sp.AAC.1